jgi:nitrate reductase alpha subunit
MSAEGTHRWLKDEVRPAARAWEEFYRNRWQFDKVVRSTHGVNCTGGCTWQIYVKDGLVTWEMQGLDYPSLAYGLPPYEPRGCQRGISFSWYLYSPLRIKYPYIRGALLDLWQQARAAHEDPVAAWKALVEDPAAHQRWQQARGKGGFRRTSWDTVEELIAAACIYTIQTYGPDRIVGFSPIPAMSMISYAGGARFLQLLGGVLLSFYDWYSDLPPASPETWGEQTDVHESADWFNAKLLAVVGSNLNMTRTPDCHFAAEARHNGSKMWVFSPDFNQVSKYADEWVAIRAGQDDAWWLAVNHVLLREFHHERPVSYFLDYLKKYTDAPYLVELKPVGSAYRPGQLVRANRLATYQEVEHGDWKFLIWDEADDRPRMPQGSVGFRWGREKGKWNLRLQDGLDGNPLTPLLTFLGRSSLVVPVQLEDFEQERTFLRGVPAQYLETASGETILVTTVYDLLLAQYGVPRGLEGEYPADYHDENQLYTPAWSEKYTGIDRQVLIRFAREWGQTAEKTQGKCLIIIGAGVNHWYHNNLKYRAAIHALMFCGCVGVNGGGLAHYVGQEKLAPLESWSAIAFARDWQPAARLQNASSWHYVHSDQWRYEKEFAAYHPIPSVLPSAGGEHKEDTVEGMLAHCHTVDLQVQAVRRGWLPFYPQFTSNPLHLVREAEAALTREDKPTTEDEIISWIVRQLQEQRLHFAVEDPDAPENWPRVWFIWRGNALLSSAKGHEYFLKHYLGTHTNAIAKELAQEVVREVCWREPAPQGKMDLVVDLNFRMDTSALYSDIVLPAATWYEKADLNTTDLHSFIHPLSPAVPPCWESRSDWQIFRSLSKKFTELARKHFPAPVRDVLALPLAHDTPAEIAQADIQDWWRGQVEAIPGKTMPALRLVTRDYSHLYQQFVSFGPLARTGGLSAHGIHYDIADEYEAALQEYPTIAWEGQRYLSLEADEQVCDIILRFASVTNGELSYRAYQEMERKTGLPLVQLVEKDRSRRVTFKELQSRPQRFLNTPLWSGLLDNGRAYSPFTCNVEYLVPWRTLTGRQHFYLDHPWYLAFGEHLPVRKPNPPPAHYADLQFSQQLGPSKMLNYLTPHGKWHIHTTYADNQRMTTLSRGIEPLWLNDRDAAELGIQDNDWVEIHNDHGVVVTRAVVSARIPQGICIQYHAPERTYSVPKSPLRGYRRAGGHNSLTRIRLKPVLLAGGYGQFTYHFNYWGPTGVNRDTHVLVRKLTDLRW